VGRNKHTKKNRSLSSYRRQSTLTKTGTIEAVLASGKIGDEKQIENGIRASGNQISPGYEAAAPNKIFFSKKRKGFSQQCLSRKIPSGRLRPDAGNDTF
jgi:hypothetical protein